MIGNFKILKIKFDLMPHSYESVSLRSSHIFFTQFGKTDTEELTGSESLSPLPKAGEYLPNFILIYYLYILYKLLYHILVVFPHSRLNFVEISQMFFFSFFYISYLKF